MNKSHQYLDKMLAMVMLAYTICLLVGETIRAVQYAQVDPKDVSLLTVHTCEKTSRWHLFSGPFLLLKQRYRLNRILLRQIAKVAFQIFAHLIYANVRTLVRT